MLPVAFPSQRRCTGTISCKWKQWDPKITTPPGLYVIAWALNKVGVISCSLTSLRAINPVVWSLATLLVYRIRRVQLKPGLKAGSETVSQDIHAAFNICLLPPVWFFTGLFYTDVASTFVVLATLEAFYSRRSGFLIFILGATSLLFRQTNIFWVAIFPAGLTAIAEIQRLSNNAILDPTINEACAVDYIKFLWSLSSNASRVALHATQSTYHARKLLLSLSPYAALVGLFAGFVAWNGGVVLGDKSNHVATIHVPQLLYLFAYIAFFSLPLLLPLVAATAIPSSYRPTFLRPFSSPINLRSGFMVATLLTGGVALPAIHFNTIIHPFTLADNRHYVFYVFRILRTHPLIRYTAAPLYIIGAWAAIQVLGSRLTSTEYSPSKQVAKRAENAEIKLGRNGKGPTVGFVFVWLIASTLCLVTAPLVEPRYFILPWIVWRLQVPSYTGHSGGKSQNMQRSTSLLSAVFHADWRLYFETAWLMLINGITAYVFLNWSFAWPQEPGKSQRFLW
ncbi:hypothetical protein FH972_025560 [Carpinus fangiana]|uniref:Dol-P-Glc:Glc(2)Man(9)GlcNAc(2)-PP-Dol alpha-1,2-glucosyltransferase n=1 Tax=Carpinus fangiana TaxID=176857 RepID=A0A5N6L1D5_9ROSI|nr:hypothetical protein FH972_025560 [Carpinus fangiana]